MRILIVDDNTEKAKNIAKVATPYSVPTGIRHVTSADAAKIELAPSISYDVLIVDLRLPLEITEEPDDDSGLQLIRDIKRSRRYNKPTFYIGCTEHEDCHSKYRNDFLSEGIVLLHFERNNTAWEESLKNFLHSAYEGVNRPHQERSELDFCFVTALEKEERADKQVAHKFGVIKNFLMIP